MPAAIWLARQFPRARISLRASNQVAQAAAARSGAGLALLPHYIGRVEKGLRPCKLKPVPGPDEVWLLTRRRSRGDLPVQTLVEHIARIFAKDRALLEP
jgi:DNA-binding transcriptional LysR family regulator